jgi:hypothetical protein
MNISRATNQHRLSWKTGVNPQTACHLQRVPGHQTHHLAPKRQPVVKRLNMILNQINRLRPKVSKSGAFVKSSSVLCAGLSVKYSFSQ